jgi:hypothetical protein
LERTSVTSGSFWLTGCCEIDRTVAIRWIVDGSGDAFDGEEVGKRRKSCKQEEKELENVVWGKVRYQQSSLPFWEITRSEPR